MKFICLLVFIWALGKLKIDFKLAIEILRKKVDSDYFKFLFNFKII